MVAVGGACVSGIGQTAKPVGAKSGHAYARKYHERTAARTRKQPRRPMPAVVVTVLFHVCTGSPAAKGKLTVRLLVEDRRIHHWLPASQLITSCAAPLAHY